MYNHFQLTYSAFKSDPNLQIAQAPHCDVAEAGYFNGGRSTKFPFVILLGIEQYTFLDIESINTNLWSCVCIKRGHILFFRGDVIHHGCENNASHDHFRVHIYVDPKSLDKDEKIDRDKTIYVPDCDITDVPKYVVSTNQWISSSNILEK